MGETRDELGPPPEPPQAGSQLRSDRRQRYEERKRAAGFTRCIVRCHVEDVDAIKAYAAKLLAKWDP